MKLNLLNFQKSITFLLVFFMVVSNAQNAIVGTGFAGAWPGSCSSVSGATYLSANIGTTFGSTGLTPNGTGNQYWRLGIDWSGSIYQINNGGTTDALVAPNTTYNAAVTCQGSGALYYNVPNASYRYVFKTLNGGVSPTGTWVFFEVQGAVQNVSSVTASPSAAPPVNMPVTVTATTSGALSTGQAVYLRYTTNAWSTSTVVPMTGSGTTYNATIPGFTAGTNVSYYVFTSAPTNVASNGSNADLYTMTWNAGAVNGGSNYSYTVSATTANVWVTSTGGTGAAGAGYATLSAAFTAINAGTHTGVINVSILADTTEPADPVDLLRSNTPSSYTSIVIKPSGNRTITGSGTTTNTSVIDLLGADNVMIDGDDPSTLGLQNLTITQPTSTNRIKACIKIASNSTTGTDGADNVTIKNCILIGSRSGSTSTQVNYGIVMTNGATLATGSYSSLNVVIGNNNITRCWNAIHANGVSATYPNTGLQILNNTLGTPASGIFADATTVGSRGILLTYTAASSGGAIIRGNDIRVGVSTTGYASTIAGIEVGTVNYGFVIDKNNIHDIVQPESTGYGAHGIYITANTNNTLSAISNNFIRDVKMVVYQTSSTSTFIPAGIFFTAGATGVNIVNNTIVMGAQLGSGSNFSSFGVNASVNGVRIAKFLNNNIVNNHSSTFAYGLYCSATLNISGGTINNNNYYVPNTGHVGYYNGANRTALSDWQTATSKDGNSYSVNPSFVSATDLHLNTTGNSNFESTGAVVGTSGVSDDYDGQTRPGPTGSVNGGGTAPDIGADEFDGVPLILCTTPSAQPTAFTAGVITQTTVAGSFTAATGSPSGYLVVRSPGALSANPVDGTTYAAGATLGNGTVIQSGSTLSFAPTGLTSNTAYTITIFSFNGGSCSGGPLYLTTSPLTGTLTTCAATPTVPTVTSITTTGATIGWTASAAGGGAGTISYTVNVFTDAARTIHAPNSPYAATTSVSQAVTGLSAATTYYYRIVASNGNCNSGNLDGSFTTACTSLPITQNQGFNATTAPTCWSTNIVLVQTGTKISYVASGTNPTTSPQEGTHMILYSSFSSTNGGSGSEERLVSVPLSSIGTNSVDIEFYLRNENSTSYNSGAYLNEGVQVQYSTDGTTWTNAGSFFPRYDSSLASGTAQWKLKTVTVPSALANLSTFYVGFKFRSEFGNNIFLDNVTVKPTPTCANNTVTATTAIASTTATINWTASASAPANGYEWEVRSSGNGGTGFTGLAASGVVAAGVLTENVTGLAANTAYTVWVRANCGAGGYSQWVSGGVFTTTQVPATIPYLDDFSSNNYSFVNGSQTNKWFYGAVTGNPANAIYVSSDASGTTNDYNVNATSVVHSYRDIAIPSGTTTSVFSFDWKANAEACCDYVRVWLVPTSFIPTAGTQITTGSGRIQVGGNLNAQTAWQTYSNAALDVSSFAGATMRLIFEWRNDGSLGSQNAAAIDNVSLDLPCAATVTSATATAICGSGSVTIVAAGSLGTTELRLYTTSTGGVSIDTEMSASGNLITPSISTTTIFYVAAFNGTCETSPRVAVTATVNPAPNDITIQSTINGVDACNQNYVELSITGNNAVAVFKEGFETDPVTKFNLQASGSGEFYDEPYFTEGSNAISLVGAGDIDFSSGNTRITLANSIDLSQYASATLTFDHICASEATYDFGYIQYSLDGGTSWTSFPTTAYSGTGTLKNGVVSFDKSSYTDWNTQFTSSTSTPGSAPATSLFKSETIDLNSFITNTNFRIRFRLAYDDFVDYYGWIIDNVKINVVPKITWSPNTGLYTDSALTIAYAGAPATVVYAMPNGSETYTATTALGTCNKTDTEVVVNNTKRYVGANGGDWNIAASWFPVGIPTIDDCVRIAADKSVVVPTTVIALANTLTLESNTALFSTVGNAVLKLNNALVNLGTGSNVIFDNNSSLVQINDVNNTGNITYNRTSPLSVIWSDYVYWSSPVSGQTVTSGNNYYWNNAAGTSGNWAAASGSTMDEGKGFIFRGIGTKSFVGVPYNGDVTVDVYRRDIVGLNDNWNLIGNPYPSAISADEFIAHIDNTSIEGSVALWTHGSAPSSAVTNPFYGSFTYNYNPNDYIIYNSFASQSGPSTFDGNIAAGQAFFVKMNDGATATSGTVKFKNSMRTDGSNNAYNNSQFYRSTQAISNIESIEKHRIWLDIVDTNMLSYRTTIGYTTNATDLKDRLYDAYTAVTPTMMSTYSLLGVDKLAIKANALPFDENDEFAIGYNVPIAGIYSIAIHAVDGLFEDQEIYLEDLELNIVHNLKNSPYSFTTTQGEINSRFKIIFTNQTLDNPNFDINNAVIVANNDDLKVFSNIENIESIVVYDLLGRTIFTKENVDANHYIIPVEKAHAPLILKIKLANGIVVERKTLF